jgi:hypothetical protein
MVELPSDVVLQRMWNKIRRDPQAAKALRKLELAGYDGLSTIPTSKDSITGAIALVPFLPNERARSRLQPKLPSARPIIRFLRELTLAARNDYSNLQAHDKRGHWVFGKAFEGIHPRKLEEMTNFLDWVFSMRWLIIHHNPRKLGIYEIREDFIDNTGKSHDAQILDLLDAAFRAAGKPHFKLEIDDLKKIRSEIYRTEGVGARRLVGPSGL